MNPVVTAVIPTRNRPELVCRAVRSALAQTYSNLEVVVVVDGPDPATVRALELLKESRMRIVALEENVGGSEARNVGVREARGEWIAFLDDDDEWLREKIEKQVAVISKSTQCTNFVACRWEARGIGWVKIMPREFPSSQEDWGEYIYCRGESLPTSTYLVKKDFMLATPFTKGLPANQDIDWFLRVRTAKAIVPEWLDEPLIIYNSEETRTRISTSRDWRFRYQWAIENRNTFLTRKAFSYCLLLACVPLLKRSRDPVRSGIFLLYKAITVGRIDMRFCVRFISYGLWGVGARRKIWVACKHVRSGHLKVLRGDKS